MHGFEFSRRNHPVEDTAWGLRAPLPCLSLGGPAGRGAVPCFRAVARRTAGKREGFLASVPVSTSVSLALLSPSVKVIFFFLSQVPYTGG